MREQQNHGIETKDKRLVDAKRDLPRHLRHRIAARCRAGIRWLIGFALALSVAGPAMAKEDRVNIDPNQEMVLVTIGGIDMDIPLGYFYEKTIWAKGQWPKPPKTRSLVREQIVIDVHLDGMRPWTPETAVDFKGSGLNTTRVTITANQPAQWFENWLRAKPRLKITESKYALPGLKALRVEGRPQVFYLKDEVISNSRFYVDCDERPVYIACNVKFAYSPQLVVNYLIPVRDLGRWEVIHSGIIKLLDSFQTVKGE